MTRPEKMIAYGAVCSWWDSKDKVGQLPSGLPCCPHCGLVLYEMEETRWWASVDAYSKKMKGYREAVEQGQGKCNMVSPR